MKLKFSISLIFVILGFTLLISCNKCKDYDCFTPPQSYKLILMDSANGNDLIYNGTFEIRFIKIINNKGQVVETNYSADSTNQKTIINSTAFWNTDADNINYNIKIQVDTGDIIIPFEILQKEHNENCCTFYSMEKFNIFTYQSKISNNEFCEIYLDKPIKK